MKNRLPPIGKIPVPKAGKAFALRDLAKLASVDVSTVSRALNHDSRVNAERASMIRQLAEQIGYRPRPLRSKRARSIGLLVQTTLDGSMIDQFLERVAWTTQRLLGERRMHVNLERISSEGPKSVPAVVQQNRVDGVLLAGSPSAELVQQIRDLGVPAVAINDSVERLGISCVRSDPRPAIHQAVVHLAARGHEAFAMLLKRFDYPTAKAKYETFTATLRELGIEPRPEWLVTDLKQDLAGGREGIRQLQQRGPLPTAILCENDWVALGALHELQRQQIRVPEDISIMGHDDLWLCDKTEPTLTSIHRAEETLVQHAIDLLVEQLDVPSTPAREILIEGEMVWRQSTGPAPQRRHES